MVERWVRRFPMPCIFHRDAAEGCKFAAERIVAWCRLEDSNPRPDDYKSTALPTELSRHMSAQGAPLAENHSGV